MNEARLEVGMQGQGLASAAYEHARDYARERIQSRAIWDMANPDAKLSLLSNILIFAGLCCG